MCTIFSSEILDILSLSYFAVTKVIQEVGWNGRHRRGHMNNFKTLGETITDGNLSTVSLLKYVSYILS